jgi:propionate CoA-transferase
VVGVTFSGAEAIRRGQTVKYVTERSVFELTPQGVELTEYAPGIDLRRDILERMQFAPIVRNPVVMDSALFAPIQREESGPIETPLRSRP